MMTLDEKGDRMKNLISKLLVCAGISIANPIVTANGTDIYIESEQDIAEEIYYDSLEYLACCVEAEAEDQGLMGKRLVCDVILNRVDSKDFPDNIFDVINQKNQFSVVSNGRIYDVSISDETFEACSLELEERTDRDILYFSAGGYSACGSPAYKYKDHYFSRCIQE